MILSLVYILKKRKSSRNYEINREYYEFVAKTCICKKNDFAFVISLIISLAEVRMMQKLCSWLLIILLLLSAAQAETTDEPEVPQAAITQTAFELMGHSVSYPVYSGENEEQVNQLLMETGDVRALSARVAVVLSQENKLHLSCDVSLNEAGILTAVYTAQGPLTTLRDEHRISGITIDTQTGERVQLSSLFTDAEEAQCVIGNYLTEQVAPQLSPHLENSELLPLPESYYMNERGVVFCYDPAQLMTLKGRAGDVVIPWTELKDVLDMAEGHIPDRLGVRYFIQLNEASWKNLAAFVKEGCLPGIPAHLGDAMSEVLAAYPMLKDADLARSGRVVSPEGAAFQGVQLLTDRLHDDFSVSVVSGIRVDEGCVSGLLIGQTTREVYIAVFGEAESAVQMNEETAALDWLMAGISDYYSCGENLLRLHADEEGVLRAVWIMK